MKILVVIILYHPDKEKLSNLIKYCLANKDCDVFLSDNANVVLESVPEKRVIYQNNAGNIGIGAAQNKGIAFGIAHQYDYIILFDQDSDIHHTFVKELVTAFEAARQQDKSIIAAGPSFQDTRFEGRRSARGKMEKNTYKKMIIASGSIMAAREIEKVGLMDEALFIDHVDTEWCYRAQAKGYRVMQLSSPVMDHSIGEMKKLWFGYSLQYHKAFRYYYFFRNSLILFKRKYIPLKARIYILGRNISYVLKIIFLTDRLDYIKYMLTGLKAGIGFSSKNT